MTAFSLDLSFAARQLRRSPFFSLTIILTLALTSLPLFVATAALLSAATLAATLVPARRAMQIDPMQALRSE